MKNFGRNTIFSLASVLLATCWLFTAAAQAASPGAAQVKKIVGTATYTDTRGGGPLKETDILMEGATITTGAGSYVDLDMGVNGNALRIEADSTLTLNKLSYTKAGDTIVNTQLEVKKGAAVANVITKLSKASKYEIKTPAGVAGIRGTVVRVATTRVVCLIGKVEFRTVNGQLQLVIGGTVFAAGATAPVKATSVETTGLATAATSCTANTQAANMVTQAVKQFTTVVAAEAAAEAGPAGAAKAAADTAKAVLAALMAAVKEAADSAPPAIRAAAQAAASDLAKRSEAIQATSAADGAALGTVAGGGTTAQATANANAAADQSSTNPLINRNAKKNAGQVAKEATRAKDSGSSSAEVISGGVDGGLAGQPVSATGQTTTGGGVNTQTQNTPPPKPPEPFESPTTGASTTGTKTP